MNVAPTNYPGVGVADDGQSARPVKGVADDAEGLHVHVRETTRKALRLRHSLAWPCRKQNPITL